MDQSPQAPSVSAPEPTPVPQAPAAPMPPAPPAPSAPVAPAPSTTAVSSNTGMAILAYLGILVIVPFFTDAKNDPFVKFHIKQGLALIIAWIVMGIVSVVMGMAVAIPSLFFLSFLIPLIDLGLLIINIIGIINAATGKQKELPVIGSFARGFNF